MKAIMSLLRKFWHSFIIADAETSKRLDEAEIEARIRQGRMP